MDHNIQPEHLGDGAYVSITGDGIWITANHHNPDQATDSVHLDGYAIAALVSWLQRAGVKFPDSSK